METKNLPIVTSPVSGNSSCHGSGQSSGTWFGRRRGLFLAGVVATGVAIGLSQHWLTVAELTPLLFILPCLVMMFMCMKGMNHGQRTNASSTSASTDTPAREK
jgi:hypothetical protein